MIKCEKCNNEHDGSYGSGRFCNKVCASGFSTKNKRLEINKKVSEKLKGRICNKNSITEKEKLRRIEFWNLRKKENFIRDVLEADFNTLKFDKIRNRIIFEQNEKCNRCDLGEWQNEKIALEINHIDGNNTNNLRENLEALCPNCHSLTPTWRGRNVRNKRNKISDEYILSVLIDLNFNFRQTLLKIGLSPKGGNYNRCHRLKREYDKLNE